ncbi:unnamed protein product [Pieris macdunnoughi]|uniref:2-(3-amino-3-carboxypropyl)histidine synthase subunit 2 n=1 Tax=Pieris macdunnoughi TaxID=345717 RepID=A0A821XWW9_9NEOP|nr:unnamed protein product [Pieris macdunnoughi]
MANLTTDGKLCIEREIDVQVIDNDETEITSRYLIADTCNWINSNKYTKVCLQFPDELLGISSKVYEELKKGTEADLYILGDTSYASCCADVVASMHVQSNAIVHYGHTCFSKTNIPVYIVLNQKSLDIDITMKILRENLTDFNLQKLCLLYDCEFNHLKDELTEKWFQQYPNSYIASISFKESINRFFGRIVKNVSSEEYSSEILKDCVCIYVGSRGQTFFNFTVSVEAEKWYLLDPASNQLDVIQETIWFKRRRFLIEKCKDANVVGILVCKLAGDQTKQIISRMKQLCKANGKKCYVVSVGKPNVAKLANFPEIDIYVMIACPENDLYDSRDFYQALVYPYELEVALNTNRDFYFTSHITNYEELLPGNKHYKDINDICDSTDVSLITGKIRETKVTAASSSTDLVEKQNWQLENIGQSLSKRSWKGLEQKLGESNVKQVEEGRKGIPLQYLNEPE